MRFENAFAAAAAVFAVVFSAAFQPAEAATTTYTGPFSTPATINAGDTALLNNGATISGTGVITTNGTLQVNQTATNLVINNPNTNPIQIAGTGTFSLTNTGTVTLEAYPRTPLDLTTSVSAGELRTTYGLDIGRTGTGTLNVSGGRVSVNPLNASPIVFGIEVGSVGTATVSSGTLESGYIFVGGSGTGLLTVNGGVVNSGQHIFIGADAGGVGSVIVSGGTVSTYSLTLGNEGTGTLTINNGGLVSVDGDLTTSVTAGTASIVNINAGGTLKMNGDWYAAYPDPVLSANLVNNGTLIFDNFNPVNEMFAAGTISGTGSVTKQGDGTWVVGGSNSYTGPTNVNAGVLFVEGLLGNTAVTVNAGGLLAGSGTILGNVTVASSGTIAPFSAYYTVPQALTVGSLSLSTNSFAVLNISGTTPLAVEYDQLVGSGTAAALTYDGNLDLLLTGSYATGTTWNLFSNFLTKNGDFADVGVTASGGEYDGLTFTNTSGVWKSTTTANGQYLEFTQSTGNLVVVPEPSTIAMTLAGLACGGWQVLRRGRRLRQAASLSA